MGEASGLCRLPAFQSLSLLKQSIWLPTTGGEDRDNLSGASYDVDRDSLWVIRNNPRLLQEIDLDTLGLKRQIKLKGFEDTEGVAFYDADRVLILEEERASISLCDLDEALLHGRICWIFGS